jgi:hypothetical protein
MAHIAPIKPYDTFDNVKEHVKRGRLLSKGATLTVSSAGVITVTDSYHLVAVASGSTDNLQVINSEVAAQAGQIVVLQAADDAKTIVVKDYAGSTDNIRIGADVTLDDAQDTVTLMWNGSAWNMMASSATTTAS